MLKSPNCQDEFVSNQRPKLYLKSFDRDLFGNFIRESLSFEQDNYSNGADMYDSGTIRS